MAKLTRKQIEGLQKTADPELRKRFLFLFLHPNLKEVLSSDFTTEIVEKIVKDFNLMPQQHIALSQIVMKVLTAELASAKIREKIIEDLKLTPEVSQEIADQINQKIFAPIQQELDEAYKEAMTPAFVKRGSQAPAETTPTEAVPPETPADLGPVAEEAPSTGPTPALSQKIPRTISAPDNLPIKISSRDRLLSVSTEESPSSILPPEKREEEKRDIRTLAKGNPQILEQQITSNYLKEAGSGNAVPATVRNWLVDYTRVAGATRHSGLDRGRYLFKSPNAKTLSEPEKQILSQILQSYDEGTPVKIDEQTGLLVLPKRQNNFQPQRSDEVRGFQIQPMSFGNIVDLQDI